MSDKLKKLQIKKLIQEYNFLVTDFEYKNQIIDDNKQEFINKVSEMEKNLGIKKEIPLPVEDSKKSNVVSEVPEETKNKIKKIYREIVKLTHPDKVKSDESIELYHKATKCSENNDLICLYLILIELGSDFELEVEDITFLEKIINLKKKENSMIETSCVWAWVNSDNEEVKDKLLKIYILNNK